MGRVDRALTKTEDWHVYALVYGDDALRTFSDVLERYLTGERTAQTDLSQWG